jgi:endonuclease G, mitochondrial
MNPIFILVGALILLNCMSAIAADCGQHTEFGIPGNSDQLLCREGFAVGYSYSHKAPEWVAYKLSRNSVLTDLPRKNNLFSVDTEIPKEHRSNLTDFRGSGYDRGHMAPVNLMSFSNDAMKESFLLSNIVPQKSGFNRYSFDRYGAWGALENYVRNWAVSRNEIYVISGPVYQSVIDVIGNGIEVPSHFYKIVFDPEYRASIAFLIPHIEDTAVRLPDYVTTIDCIESLTGLDFLKSINGDDEADIENGLAYDFDHWSMRDGKTIQATCYSEKLAAIGKSE